MAPTNVPLDVRVDTGGAQEVMGVRISTSAGNPEVSVTRTVSILLAATTASVRRDSVLRAKPSVETLMNAERAATPAATAVVTCLDPSSVPALWGTGCRALGGARTSMNVWKGNMTAGLARTVATHRVATSVSTPVHRATRRQGMEPVWILMSVEHRSTTVTTTRYVSTLLGPSDAHVQEDTDQTALTDPVLMLMNVRRTSSVNMAVRTLLEVSVVCVPPATGFLPMAAPAKILMNAKS